MLLEDDRLQEASETVRLGSLIPMKEKSRLGLRRKVVGSPGPY